MKRLLEVGTICIVTLVLAGCFPSQRLYKVEICDDNECGKFVVGSELALVKETSGDNWRLWQKKPSQILSEVCTGTINDNEFGCDACGPGKTLKITKANSSECGSSHCMKFELSGPNCPNGGSGKGGHN
jgi:hypothetical protein